MSYPNSEGTSTTFTTNNAPHRIISSPKSEKFGKKSYQNHQQVAPNISQATKTKSATLAVNPSDHPTELHNNQKPTYSLYDILMEAELTTYFSLMRTKLKLQHAEHLRDVRDEDLTEIGMSKPEQRRLWKVFHKRCPTKGFVGKIKRKVLFRVHSGSFAGAGKERREVGENLARSQSLEAAPCEQHIIPASSITLCKQLGVGEFGSVWQGIWNNSSSMPERLQVAVKCVSSEKLQANPLDFLGEAAIMHKISHQNIVRLYGVVLETKTIMLVNELAPLRSLLECLKESNLRSSFPVLKLCDYAQQVGDGMAYLESKRLIHRDLAARNILVFSSDKVKISDFGLSRALGVGEEYYRTNFSVNLKLPIAWCAPECITFLKFTSASDVWAFGVTLWEMFTYGFQPWAGMNGQQILDAIDTPRSQRLEIPESCPQEFYSLMLQCWEHDASNRPKFSDIQQVIPEIHPDRVQAICPCKDGQWDHLQYSNGTIITVLNKRPKEYPDGYYWKGALQNGKIGLFLPSNTVAYFTAEFPSLPANFCQNQAIGGSLGNLRASFGKGKVTAWGHQHHGGVKIDRKMISGPQGDLRHTGHVGVDGSYFGEIGGISKNNLPKQVVAPLVMDRARSCTNSPLPLGRFPVPDGGSVAGSGRMESTTSESALLIPGRDRPGTGGTGEVSLDPMVSPSELEREIGRDSPDLDVPKFEMGGEPPSLLDEVFEELERGSMCSRMRENEQERTTGASRVRSTGEESEVSEPTSPTMSLHPVDTTDTTKLLSAKQQGSKLAKPEAHVRPLSHSDAQLLNDFTHMAQKMSDRAFKLDREQRTKEMEEKEWAAGLVEIRLQGGAEEGVDDPQERREKSPPKLKEKLARLKVSRQNSREDSETTGSGELNRKCFSDNLPKEGADMFSSDWSPMAEDAYKALIECGNVISTSTSRSTEESPCRSPKRTEQISGIVPRQKSPADNRNGAKEEVEEESNPLRLLRKDAAGVARSFKPGGAEKGGRLSFHQSGTAFRAGLPAESQ